MFDRLITLAQQTGEETVETASDEPGESSEDEDNSTNDGNGQEESRTTQCMSELQRACLSFCNELLNQTIHNREYDMALVCALAALGVSPSRRGCRGADTYP